MSPELVRTHLHIGGEWIPAEEDRTYDVFNPARPDELVGSAARANAADVDRAMEAAHAAFPDWAALGVHARAAYLERIAKVLVDDPEELQARVHLFTREHGKILREASIEMGRLGSRFEGVAAYADRLATEERLEGPPLDTIITRRPHGVALLIVPWNWPLSILGGKLPQALLAGNTVVIKLAQSSPLGPALTIRKIADALPPGVVNLVTGSSSEIGDALLTHPRVNAINFTGSIEVGRHVMSLASERLVPVTLELGGNDPGLVLDDADLGQEAIRRMVIGAFLSAGQVCMALKRLYVHRSRFDEFVESLTGFLARTVVGDGLLPDVTMGPLNNEAQFRKVRAMIDQAAAAGTDLRILGTVRDEAEFARGYFVRPTLAIEPDPSLDLVAEEQFGPVLPVMSFDDEDEVIERANDSRFALCSSVWTGDRERALSVARRLEAGYTYFNNHGPLGQDSRAPFGGFKESGIGRNLGYDGVLAFLGAQSMSGDTGWLL